jgi:hypothetical protein
MKPSLRGWALGIGALVAILSLFPLQADTPPDPAEGGEWALAKLKRPALPAVKQPGWAQNAVDHFIQSKVEANGLVPNRPADRLTILKRVTYDLTGLAPTPEERDAFLNDDSVGAYEKLVERLLASVHFGERWAQHWLDLVRYSETDGFKLDRYRPNAWRYRDYVIRAFNADLPYDRFMRQQIAGDELEPDNPEAVLATGFLRLHPEETNGANYRQIRQDILDDITEVAGLTFLGLTVGCARCHDHKFDPISQEDYFEMQAFFAGIVPRDTAPLLRGREEKEYRAKLAAWEKATEAIRNEMDAMLVEPRKQVFQESVVGLDEETQKALKTPENERTSMQMQLAALGVKQIARKYDLMYRRLGSEQQTRFLELRTKLATFDAMKPEMPMAMAVTDAGPNPPPTFRLGGGDYRRPKREVRPDFLDCIHAKDPVIAPPRTNPQSSGRRSAFANWLSEPDHPLTSRVIVNRLWQEYFGKGIVATPSDFGAAGQRPTHPELLDFLASELVAKDWSLKAIHRLIVTSATYRQASAPEFNARAPAAAKADPDNRLLWHARVRRRDAESIRDAALEASGLLNRRMFDASACPELPASILSTSRAWYPDEKVVDRNRRSIYVFNRRNLIYPLFAAFDSPNRSMSCPTRTATVSAPQALLMLNGEFSLQQARALAGSLASRTTDRREMIRQAYDRVLSRAATADDIARAETFLSQQADRIGAVELPEGMPKEMSPALAAAVVDFCHALLNSAEFLNVE